MILHEYGHAIQHDIVASWSGGDTGAMGEGFGDYWAGSYSYITPNGDIFYPDWIFTWDGHGTSNACWSGRILNATGAQYVHDHLLLRPLVHSRRLRQSDELWSTPLFQSLRTLMDQGYSRASVDQIILESHFGIGSGLKMRDMANLTIAAAPGAAAGRESRPGLHREIPGPQHHRGRGGQLVARFGDRLECRTRTAWPTPARWCI